MKLKKIIVLWVSLQAVFIVQASSSTTITLAALQAALTNLSTAQTTLTGLLTPSNSVGMITNMAKETVSLCMLDSNNKQINPSYITLKTNDFSYLPSNVAQIALITNGNILRMQPTAINPNSVYNISQNGKHTSSSDGWVITAVTNTTATYSFNNSTTVPILLEIILDNKKISQNIAAGDSFTQSATSSIQTTKVEAHANISGLYSVYNPTYSYELTINNNQIVLTQTTNADKVPSITNNTGWPMLLCSITSTNDKMYTTLSSDPKAKNYPKSNVVAIQVTPSISNYSEALPQGKSSCTISNNAGQLAMAFAN